MDKILTNLDARAFVETAFDTTIVQPASAA